jgi:hypothetical protein
MEMDESVGSREERLNEEGDEEEEELDICDAIKQQQQPLMQTPGITDQEKQTKVYHGIHKMNTVLESV